MSTRIQNQYTTNVDSVVIYYILYTSIYYKVLDRSFHSHGGTPIAEWFIVENPTTMDDLRGTHISRDLQIVTGMGPPFGSVLLRYKWLNSMIFGDISN